MVQPNPMPETMISADPEFYLRRKLSKTAQGTSFFDSRALAEYIRCIKDSRTVYGMCEDYRATFGVDLEMDGADFKTGRKVTCPAMILWGANGGVGRNHDAAAIWSQYATRIERTATVPSGHYLQEECPDETYRELRDFFASA